MKILSIRQPWAWAILTVGKDIENRSWWTNVRGRVLLHASLKSDFDACMDLMDESFPLPPEERLRRRARALHSEAARRGGIVGSVEICDCIDTHPSDWFFGRYGFVLREPRVLPFIPLKGRLGFWDAPAEVMDQVRRAA